MLTNSIFIIIGSKRWSKILTRTLNLNLIYGTYSISKVTLKKYREKKVVMSEQNKKSDTVGAPSTSGSNHWNYSCDTWQVSNIVGQNVEPQVNNFDFNVLMMNPILTTQGYFTNFNDASNYGTPNGNFFTNIAMQQCVSTRYYGTERRNERSGPPRNRHLNKQREKELLSRRVWENVNKKVSTRPGFIFTLMSYNVLAQDLLSQHPYLYQHHNKESLNWKTRWNNLFKEIKRFSPDILCLQEVQESHIKDYFSLLETLGYSSLYKRRTGLRTEGCAVYYKADVINLVEYTTVEFYQPKISILNRDNVAIVAKFTPKLHPTREFVVATTHLLYNPKRQDVRIAQMQVLLSEVERLSYKEMENGNYVPIIITGDLNSTPDSTVYEFLTKGKLNYEELSPKLLTKDPTAHAGMGLVSSHLRITDNCQHADLLKKRRNNEKITRKEEVSVIELINSENKIEKTQKEAEADTPLFSTGALTHNFNFNSVYDYSRENKIATTFQEEWVTVDYIFYSGEKEKAKPSMEGGKLQILARYRLPTINELNSIRIPNSTLGSDHLSLVAKFKLEY